MTLKSSSILVESKRWAEYTDEARGKFERAIKPVKLQGVPSVRHPA